MKTILFLLFLIMPFYNYAQDSVKVAGYGSMSDFPGYPKNNAQIGHFEFSNFTKNTNVEITLWDFENSVEQTKQQLVLNESLNIKENPRIDLIINKDNKNNIHINCSYIGKYMSIFPVKSETELLPYYIESKPREKNKTIPIMLFVKKQDNINQEVINKICSIKELNLENDKDKIQDFLSHHLSFKLLTYKLTEQ